MKSVLYFIPVLLLAMACGGSSGTATSKVATLNTFADSLCYAFGSLTADDLKTRGVTLKGDVFGKAVEAEVNGTSTMSEAGMFACFTEFSKELQTAGGSFSETNPTTINLDTLSYAIGKNLGGQLKSSEISVNVAAAINGLEDTYTEGGAKIDKATCGTIMQTFTMKERQKQMEVAAAKVQPNIEAGKAFLAENATKEGVKTTASGLQYKVLTEGKGAKPAATDKVLVNYEGRLLDGTVFDSSYKRGEPISFFLNQVIPGWTEGVQLMSPGAKYQFYIPQELAYGMGGSPPTIAGGATLIFDVELIEVQ